MTMIQSVWPLMRIPPATAVKKARKIRIKHEKSIEEKTTGG